MSGWISIKDYGLPGESNIAEVDSSDSDVNVCTNKGRVFSAYTHMEREYNENLSDWHWNKTWVTSIHSADVEDYLDEDEYITHWQKFPKLPEN